ncbi:GDSL-type esterase/lipase family protein [Desulfuromonas thiophila]|uniref:Lysophospholipase L1 n=1 Tax=Desulfuromonas thiophila TaxID=57664 RepID=A0A1G6ZQF3_9BACT|nr:GDSL-type esterase/lipase family protein [Desulfuromonas thiophila]SDE04085.1 Lysophospholipase L1 [Desulfuromonas thiophila]
MIFSPVTHKGRPRTALRFGASLLLVAALLTALACERGPRLAALDETAVILAFGDSLTAGTGAASGQSYPDQLAERLGRQVIASGIPGETSAEALRRLPQVLQQQQPDLVILCSGGNDLLRRQSQSALEQNLRAMLELIRQQGSAVLLIGVPQPDLSLTVPEFYPRLAREFGALYEGDGLRHILRRRELKSDSVHPNAAGYAELAGRLAELLTAASD